MDFTKIKKLIQQNGDKCILMENGEPELVVISFHEYERMLNSDKISASDSAKRESILTPHQEMAVSGRQESAIRDAFSSPRLSMPAREVKGEDEEEFNPLDDPSRDVAWPMPSADISSDTSLKNALPKSSYARMPIRLEDVQLEDLPIE